MDETIGRAVSGDAEAIGALYEHYTPIVCRYLRNYTGASDVDDLASEVWLRVLRRLSGYTDRGYAFTAWLFAVCRSVVIDARRSERRRPSGFPLGPMDWIGDGPESLIGGWDARPIVLLLLASLTPNQRRVIVLRYFGDYSIEQTMAATGLSKEGVKARQHRAEARMEKIANPPPLPRCSECGERATRKGRCYRHYKQQWYRERARDQPA
jgi:RNA polymerase sigma-70 factor (ECF subfamily)